MPKKIDPQLRARRVRLVRDHAQEYPTLTAATAAVARQEGVSRESVRRWLAQAEVEAAIHQHPDVADCAVIGIPHEELGEEVAAVVQPGPGTALTAEDLRAFLGERIARFKIPSHIVVQGWDLPRTAAGKLLKREIKVGIDPSAAGNRAGAESR